MSEVDLNMKRRKLMSVLIVAVFVISSLAILASPATAQDEGKYVDEIELVVRTSMNTGMGDTAEGDIDVFIHSVPGTRYEGISRDWKSKMGTWRSAGGYNSISINPAYNRTLDLPITEIGGEWRFNPFGIREVRYATNWLIDRQFIVDDIFGGYGSPRYTPMGQEDPGYDEYFADLVDDLGMTPTGDMNTAEDMITTAMEDAQADLEADGNHGELRKQDGMWQYAPPDGGGFSDVEINGVIRIDLANMDLVGHYFADQLEEVGIAVNRLDLERASAQGLWLFTDPAEQQWHFYTGGWSSTVAAKFQYWAIAQMYSSYYPFMPGGYAGPDVWKYSNETLYPIAEKLMNGKFKDTDEYWELSQEGIEIGMKESARIFTTTNYDFYLYDNEAVQTAASNVVTGYDSVFTPRTMKTDDGKMKAAQFSSEGSLYMTNWNEIVGLTDVYGNNQMRMTRDYATTYHPSEGVPIGMRANFEPQIGIDYDEDDNLVKQIDVPEDALTFNTSSMKWEEVGSDVKAATASSYDFTEGDLELGHWHDGHEITMSDFVGSWAFHKDMAYDDGEGDERYQDSYASNRPWYDNIRGVVWDEGDGKFTVYGDYAFPLEEMVGSYYSTMPSKPWQIVEAANHVVRGTNYSATSKGYSWSDEGDNEWVHFLSGTQSQVFVDTMDNMVNDGYVPDYMKEENGCPFPITASEMETHVNAIKGFYNEYDHLWDSQGPFLITSSDKAAMRVTMERFEDYPIPEDYWAGRLRTVRFEFGIIESPSIVSIGDTIDVSINARIREEFPENYVSPADSGEVTVQLIDDEGNVVKTVDANLETSGVFEATMDTTGVEAGSYNLKFIGEVAGVVAPTISQKAIVVRGEGAPVGDITVDDFSIEPEEGDSPLEVTISATVTNPTDADQDWALRVDGEVVDSGTLAPSETDNVTFTDEYEDAGDYLVTIGDEEGSFTVKGEEDTPGFTFVLLAVSAAIALVVYRRKRL